MQEELIGKVFQAVGVPFSDRSFLDRVFSIIAKARKSAQMRDGDNLKRVICEEYEDLSNRLDATGIQESCSVRNVLRTRRLANLLINDKGELMTALLPKVITLVSSCSYSLGPDRSHDSYRQQHVLKVLTLLSNSKELVRLLQSISKPYSHPMADQLIRDTLQIPSNVVIHDAHARRAALSAWLCYLRQNIGSCFATAPAIIVQNEQPELFLTDLRELLNTGRLKRTFGGVEYTVPLSSSWGGGDLRKPVVLPVWQDDVKNGIWDSPGLMLALEAVGLIDPEKKLEEKIAVIKEWVHAFLKVHAKSRTAILTSAEEIIRWVLMKHFNVTQDDLHSYDNRPKGMIHANLLMQVNVANSGMGGKGEACAQFYQKLEIACSAFKGLADNALLKAWEFSMASFAETKSEFTRWNLYSSLGLEPEEPGGIGACLYGIIKQKLDYHNQKIGEIQIEYEMVFNQLKQLELRIRHAGSERDAQWIRSDYQSKLNEFYTLEEVRDKTHAKSNRLANLFNILITTYDKMFPQYFQEVYDADMHEVSVGPYDDSPAGFRLVFKHGRANTSQWTKIRTPSEFVEDLASFFTLTERELINSNEFAGFENELSEIVTAIVNHIRTHEFLETAFYRMAKAHQTPLIKDPLEHLDKIEKKPWAYTSGGTINTLLSCYFRHESKPTEVCRWVDNPIELMVFLVDNLKQIPYKQLEPYRQDATKSILMHSPTHAFLLKPGLSPFKEAWQTESFTYTWVRDYLVKPMENFIEAIQLNEESMDFLVEHLAELVPGDFRHYFKKTFLHIHGELPPNAFRDYILDKIAVERGLTYGGQGVLVSEEIDGMLYSLLPLFPTHQLTEKVMEIMGKLPGLSEDHLRQVRYMLDEHAVGRAEIPLMSAQGLQNVCLALLCVLFGTTTTAIDYQKEISNVAQELGFAMPKPILFADSNWARDAFAFLVNPGTCTFELWRMDFNGRVGRPMSAWKQWVNGTRKEPQWGVYPKMQEYKW